MKANPQLDFQWSSTNNTFIDQNYAESQKMFAYLKCLRQDWENFMKFGKMDQVNYIRPEILSSWKRALKNNLSPFNQIPSVNLSKKDLTKRLIKNDDLLTIASPFLEAFITNVVGSGFRIDLIDNEMYILKQFGDDEALNFAAKLGIKQGSCRSEKCCGTNAIGLCVTLGQPIQLLGPEHFNEQLHCWTCSSSPIFDEKGRLQGVISMSGHYRMAHKHTLGMVIALAKAIEFSLRQNKLIKEKESTAYYLKNILDSISDGVIATDKDGIIQFFNSASESILHIPANQMVGKNLSDVFNGNSTIMRTIKQNKHIIEKELVFSHFNKTKTVIGSSFPLKSQNKSEGYLTVYKELKSASHLVKNIGGFKAHFTFDDIKGKSKNFSAIIRLAQEAATLPSNILISGESGTGKEMFAQAIHNTSYYSKGPFVGINCAAIPADLIESELFGYEGGAFTGSNKEGQTGKFQLAEGGTLFLDEVNSMSLSMQTKLLRVVQNKRFTRVGGTTEIPFTARLIAATNCDLWEEVKKGNFRDDLFYRLNVLTIEIPPLRERPYDINELISYLYIKISQNLNFNFSISEKAREILMNYNWPGNIRELENVIERSAVVAISKNRTCIEEEDIYSYKGIRDYINQDTNEAKPLRNGISLHSLEKTHIENTLRQTHGNISQAAKKLGITRKTLYSKIKKYHITP
jgi:transcriptional regulator with PAS, ATPase and Fis domain